MERILAALREKADLTLDEMLARESGESSKPKAPSIFFCFVAPICDYIKKSLQAPERKRADGLGGWAGGGRPTWVPRARFSKFALSSPPYYRRECHHDQKGASP